jgi:hypothetical protein
MKILLRLALPFVLWSFHATPSHLLISSNTQPSFAPAERLVYKVHYGWLEAGIAHMTVDPQYYTVNEKSCYKIDVAGESKGLLYLFLKMKNHFCTYLDSSSYLPQMFYRDIQEGKYTKKERMTFDHAAATVTVEELSQAGGTVASKEIFTIGTQVQDIVSAWYVLRNMDFTTVQQGDILYTPIFFDNVLYEKFKTKFLGRKALKTKLGTINTLVLAPLVPFSSKGSSIFAGENSVELYLSDDANKIPVKIKVKLLVGAVEIDLLTHEGLQHPLALQHKKK